MLSKVLRTSALILVAFVVTSSAIWAQSVDVAAASPATHTLTITIKGTIGPVLSGSDPLGFDGKKGTVTVMASESLSPKTHTATSAPTRFPPAPSRLPRGVTNSRPSHRPRWLSVLPARLTSSL